MFGIPVFNLLPSNPKSTDASTLLVVAAILLTVSCVLTIKNRLVQGKWRKAFTTSNIVMIATAILISVIESQFKPKEVPVLDTLRLLAYTLLSMAATFFAFYSFPVRVSWSRRPIKLRGGLGSLIVFWTYVAAAGVMITAYQSAQETMTIVNTKFTPEMLIGVQKYGSVVANSALTGLVVTVVALLAARFIRKVYSKIASKFAGSRLGGWIGTAKTWIGRKAVDAWRWLGARRARIASRLRRSNP